MEIQINETLKLELVQSSHAQSLFDLASKNRNHISPWMPWIENMKSVEFIQQFIAGSVHRHAAKTEYAFVIFENGKMVGRIGIYQIDRHNKSGEIGYWIGEDFQGKGIIVKSCKAIISYAFQYLDLNRIQIRCATENTKSQQIPERLNFKKEGILRQAEAVQGNLLDLVLYSILKEEWNHEF